MLNFSYNWSLFYPPAPVIPVTLEIPESSTQIQVKGQLDSGADITYIRAELAHDLELAKVGEETTLTPTDDQDSPLVSAKYSVRLIIADVFNSVIEIVELPNLPDVEILIGRDIINNWNLHLLGPSLSGRIETP